MKSFPVVLAALGLLALASPAFAHGDVMPAFGGQMSEAGDYHVEIAVRDGGLRAWVRDHAGNPVAATGKATVLAGGKKLEVPLVARNDGLSGAAAIKQGDKVAAIVSLTVAGQPVSARYAQEAVVTPALSPQAQAGGEVFARVCSVCHGTGLRGTDSGPPLLHPYYVAGHHGDDTILAAVTQGSKSHMWKFGDMPKPDGVQPGQEQDILVFLRTMQAANGLGAMTGGMVGHHH